MATRTVRLDDETEVVLKEVQNATGLPISEALKRGLRALQQQVRSQVDRLPYDIYRALDLGRGGYAIGPSTNVKRAVRAALRKKYRR
jgi:hypothetical protein